MSADPYARLDLLLSMRRYVDAEKAAREAIAADPDTAAGYTHLARALANLNRITEAEVAARTAVGKAPHDAWVHAIHGWVLSQQGKWDEATTALLESLRQNPEYAYASGQLSYAHCQAGRFADALAAADEGLKHDPMDPFLLSQRGWALKALKRLDEALSVTDAGLNVHPNSDILWNLRGCVLWDRAEARKPFAWPASWLEADRCFSEACRLDPGCRIWHDNRRCNALAARRHLTWWLGLAAGLIIAGGIAGLGLLLGTNSWFLSSIVVPVIICGVVQDMANQAESVALAAPIGWLGVPSVPLTRQEWRNGRLHWIGCGIYCSVYVGFGLYPVFLL